MVDHQPNAGSRAPRSRLFRKYALLIGTFVSTALIFGASVEIYFSYQETKAELLSNQRERARGAAQAIERFLDSIESQMGWTLHAAFLPKSQAMEQRHVDFARLLKQAPAISEISYLDPSGKEQLLISRISLDRTGSGKAFGEEPIFLESKSKGRFIGGLYFRHGTEPYMRIGRAERGRSGGVIVAEINLKLIWDVITQLEVGREGYGFAVDTRGLLIAHPDISLVLRKTDFSPLPHVAAALAEPHDVSGGIARNREGTSVLSSHASIGTLGWVVFVETPTSEALAPVYNSVIRTAFLLLVGISLSLFGAFLLSRRIVEPISMLQAGAARIGLGNLQHQIEIKSGDELEDLADEFNRMTVRLKDSYDHVERLSALKRYFSPHLAELIVSSQETSVTESHRQFITVIFCDIRNFTKFSSSADPETAMNVLRDYFDVLGRKLLDYEATINHFAGDGLMAFFNDPLTCEDPDARAVRMAVEMQQEVGGLVNTWRKEGHDLGFGIGIASGMATIGHIGTEDQFRYTAIGPVSNLASRLCDDAKDGQILVTAEVWSEVRDLVEAEDMGAQAFKGFPDPVPVLNITGLKQPGPIV